MKQACCCLAILICSSSAFAAGISPADEMRELSAYAPQRQSECEIRQNKIMATHPGLGPFEMEERYGIDFFIPASRPPAPHSYRDARTGVTFYAKSDGRTLAAIDAGGKVLWIRDPFVENNLCPYRSAHPFISWIGPLSGYFGWHMLSHTGPETTNSSVTEELNREIGRGRKLPTLAKGSSYVGISFDSSEFGYVNVKNGDFYPMGQN